MIQPLKNYYHFLQSLTANIRYGFPANKLIVIGVTGTDGKTTTASLLYHILKQSGEKVALLTTISAIINGKSYDTGFHVTTPNSFALQKYLHEAVKAKAKYFILETTSHGLDQNRVWGVPFTVGILTNVTHEHLDYHKTYKKYVQAKVKLLKKAKIAVINHDDSSYELVTKNLRKYKGKVITYGLTKAARINLKNFSFTTKLLGEFNKLNCLAAVAALKAVHIDDKTIRAGLASFKPPPGRQEVVYDKDFRVMIDFAHTPNSFKQILPEVKKITQGKLIHIFGAAGLRDSSKRSEMGKESSVYSDVIVLTAEDPRGEPVIKINAEIKKGISHFSFPTLDETTIEKNKKYCFEVPNRKDAIKFGINLAQKGDTVIITGKSHEKSLNYDGKNEESWDEFAVAKEAISVKQAKHGN